MKRIARRRARLDESATFAKSVPCFVSGVFRATAKPRRENKSDVLCGVRAANSARLNHVIAAMSTARYHAYELQLAPGDKLFVYTDGVPEASDADHQMFGAARMLAALNEDPSGAPETILQHVRSAVDGFVKDAEQFDDLTMLCVDYKGKGGADHDD